jgi:hypothetical protein
MPKKVKNNDKTPYVLAVARISLGLTMLWAFFDKLWGLGFSTCRDAKTGVVTQMCSKAWVNGGSPTTSFLKFAAKGPPLTHALLHICVAKPRFPGTWPALLISSPSR